MTTPANSLSINTQLHEAVSAIAANCDGASTKDGVGFNGSDTKFGHRASQIPASEWTPDIAADVYHMLRIYQEQLKLYGFNYSKLPNPERESTNQGRNEARAIAYQRSHSPYVTVTDNDTVIRVWNSYPIKDQLKAVGDYGTFSFGRRGTKTWDATITPLVASSILGMVEIGLDDDQREFLQIEADKYTPEIQEAVKASKPYNIQLSDVEGKLKLVTEWGQIPLPAIRVIPGRKWVPDGKYNLVSVHIGLVRLAEEYNLTISPEALSLIDSVRAGQEAMEAKEREAIAESIATDTDMEVALSDNLYPFQQAGVAYAIKHLGGTLIADEPGLGKTRQALATAEHTNSYPLLVVCPPSVKFVWLREIEKLLPNRTASVWFGKPKATESLDLTEDILIMGYPSAEAYFPHMPKLGGVVLDEGHYIKNPKAKRTKALMQILGRGRDEAGYPLPGKLRTISPMRMVLTGTPILNRPQELVSPLLALGVLTERKGMENSVGKFLYTYCNPEKGWGGHVIFKGLTPGMGEQLNNWLRRECMVRRTKKQVLTDLPDKTRAPQFIQLTASARDMYEHMEEIAAEKAAESSAEALVVMNALRKAIGEVKLAQSVAWIEEFLEETDKSLIVFATHKATQHGLIEAMRAHDENCEDEEKANVVSILGGQSVQATEKAKEIFQAKESRVAILSFDAAREGHTLTASSDVLFTQLGWNPGTHNQAEDRSHRIGQDEPVTAWYMVAMDTIDEWLWELIESKREIVNAVTDGVMAEDDETSIFNAVVERLTAKHGTSKKW